MNVMKKVANFYSILFMSLFISDITLAQSLAASSTQPIRLLVGSVPGASSDTYARIISEPLGKILGQTVLIENKSGASGIIATGSMMSSPPDGHTLQLIYTPHTLSPYLFKKLSYDPIKDVTGITMIVTSPLVLVVGGNSPIKSYKELIELGKIRPLNYGSAGIGSGGHLSGEMLRIDTGLKLTHVPYRGAAPAATAVAAGDVDFAFVAQITAKELTSVNKLRILGVTGKVRSPALSQVPTMQELGLKDFEFVNWFGLIAAAKTPPETVKKIHQAMQEVLKQADIKSRLTADGSDIIGNQPEQFTQFLVSDAKRWGPLVSQMGLKGE
jgi:tripartite-type tricarboxylate transporter receptor subunit TctC